MISIRVDRIEVGDLFQPFLGTCVEVERIEPVQVGWRRLFWTDPEHGEEEFGDWRTTESLPVHRT